MYDEQTMSNAQLKETVTQTDINSAKWREEKKTKFTNKPGPVLKHVTPTIYRDPNSPIRKMVW